jgi:hypothetical protein
VARNATDERQQQKVQKRAERRTQRRVEAIRAVMDMADGRLFVRGLIEDCGVLSSEFLADSNLQYYRAGERNVGLRILAECEAAAPKSFRLMEIEAQQRKLTDAREDEADAQAYEAKDE